MRRSFIPIAILALLLAFCCQGTTADYPRLSAIYPPALRDGAGPLAFPHNKKITFEWQSTFDLTTVELWQGPGTFGYYGVQTLVTNATNGSEPQVSWYARNLPNRNNTQPMHLYIYNAKNQDCNGCHSNSSSFTVTGSQAGNSGGHGNAKALKLGLGLGLGLGIPLVILLSGLAVWLFLRRRTRNSAQGVASPTGTSEQLMDWKEPHERPEGQAQNSYSPSSPKRAEIGGTQVAELHNVAMRSEAPDTSVGAERVELEGDLGTERR